jgi:uncharacterized protein
LKVPRLGAKAYEQSAAFLRIPDPEHPLDNSSVHPESYEVVGKMAADQEVALQELIGNKKLLHKIQPERYITEKTGLPTLKDILSELEKPGVDPRKSAKVFEFDPKVRSMADLKSGMKLPGIVNNITNFGCFVDIGIKETWLRQRSTRGTRVVFVAGIVRGTLRRDPPTRASGVRRAGPAP